MKGLKVKILFFCIVIFSLFGSTVVNAEVNSSMYVTDSADMVTDQEEIAIEGMLSNLEKQSTIEFAVVTLESLNGKSIEEVAEQTFEDMGLGKSDKDNGLLLLISLEDRKFRLEVGYGLEGVVTDTIASRVIAELKEPFQSSEYAKGIEQAIVTAVYYLNNSGEYTITLNNDYNLTYNETDEGISLTVIMIIIIAIILLYFAIKALGGSGGSSSDSSFWSSSSSDSSSSSSFGGGDSGGGGASGGW